MIVGAGQRQFNRPEAPPRRSAERVGRLDQVGAHLAQPEIGQAHQRRRGEEGRHDDPGHVADAEQKDNGDQIGEGRNGLHEVQHRAYDPPTPCRRGSRGWPNGRPTSVAMATAVISTARLVMAGSPGADQSDDQEGTEGQDRGGAIDDLPGKEGKEHQQDRLRRSTQPVLDQIEHPFDRRLDGLEHASIVRSQPSHAIIGPVRKRQADQGEGIEQGGGVHGSRSPVVALLGSTKRLHIAVDGDGRQNDADAADRWRCRNRAGRCLQARCGPSPSTEIIEATTAMESDSRTVWFRPARMGGGAPAAIACRTAPASRWRQTHAPLRQDPGEPRGCRDWSVGSAA